MPRPTTVSDYAYSQGITFSKEEWDAMMDDPVYYGYSCRMGHALREDDPAVIANGCMTCFGLSESYDWASEEEETPEMRRAEERYLKSLQDFPVIRCGKCKGTHVGVGGVRRCYKV